MDKRLSNLGLCKRADGVVLGLESVILGLQNNSIFYIFVAKDAGNDAKKKVSNKAFYYKVNFSEDYTSLDLSNAIGKKDVKVIGIKKKDFVKILE
jgi:ribosomal protein L7Ae-like RNA K-turn-binding protein